jgi:hypothetical protein
VVAARADRGQATVEALGLWAALALLVVALALGLPQVAPVLIAALHAGDGDAQAPASAALVEGALAGRTGRGGTLTLLTAERLLAVELGPERARAYLRERLLEREGARFGRAIEVTGRVAAIPVPGDRLVAYPTHPPALAIAEPGDEPRPEPDRGARAVARGAAPGYAVTALEAVERTRPLAKVLGRAQIGRDLLVLVRPPDDVGPAPGERAGDAVLCEPVELRWTMGGVRHAPLATAVHVVVVRAGRVLADRLIDAERCG